MAGKSARPERKKQQQENPQVGPCDDLRILIAQRAFEWYHARGCRDGCDLGDWLEAERDVLSQVPPV